MKKYRIKFFALCATGLILMGGCTSLPLKIVSPPYHPPQKMGQVEGTAGGVLFAFFPIAIIEREKNAYNDALKKAPGAVSLMDVTIQESWFCFGIATILTTTITGEAVR